MIVPQFWAEARVVRHRARGQSQIVVRRFGWSDISQQDAQDFAEARAQDALQRIIEGNGKLPRLELKRAYNGAVGVPIREEILQRHGDAVITRNIYGAHCLNTPDVFFADIDFDEGPSRGFFLGTLIVFATLAIGIAIGLGSWGKGLALCFGALVAGTLFTHLLHRSSLVLRGGAKAVAHRRIKSFLRRNPEWSLRLYRTPAGFRLLALHRLFDPSAPETIKAFRELGVDRVYAQMCQNQRCFRARVSPKPWRVGISHHLKPRAGTWPVKPELHAKRQEWILAYEAAAATFASCRFVADLGSGSRDPKAQSISELHDRLSQAQSTREIA